MKESSLSNHASREAKTELKDLLKQLPIGGFTPFTTIDYPDHLAAVIFTQGCPWRCSYCYNNEFRDLDSANGLVDPQKVIELLKKRQNLLDGVVFSGGEPTLHFALIGWIQFVKSLGYQVGLHTTGMFPKWCHDLFPLCDWVGFDVKAPFTDYPAVIGVPESGEGVRQSLEYLIESGVSYEVRTTVHPQILSETSLLKLANQLVELGVKKYILQAFVPSGCQNQALCQERIPVPLLSEPLEGEMRSLFEHFSIRQ